MRNPETIDEAIAAMDRLLDRSIEENDPVGYFTSVYRAVTARIRDGIRAGQFDDDERMERFDVVFAQAARRRGRPARVAMTRRLLFRP